MFDLQLSAGSQICVILMARLEVVLTTGHGSDVTDECEAAICAGSRKSRWLKCWADAPSEVLVVEYENLDGLIRVDAASAELKSFR